MIRSLLLVLSVYSFVQVNAQSALSTPIARNSPLAYGGISSPYASIEVNSLELPVQFMSPYDYASKKTIPHYFKVTVRSTKPWTVSCKSANMSWDDGKKSVFSLVTLRNAMTGQQLEPTNAAQIVLQGPGHVGSRDYFFDLIIDAPYNVKADFYRGYVDFQLNTEYIRSAD